MKKYDAIIIGSGQGGTPLSKRLAKAGWKTALIEKRWVGGTCINDGCTPSKTLVASAKMAYQAARSKDYGIDIEKISVDLPAVMQRKNNIVTQFREAAKKRILETPNLDLIKGNAVFSGKKMLTVTFNDKSTDTFFADYIFLDTGTVSHVPQIHGIENIHYFTSAAIMEITEIPEHLIIVGAGSIGMEFAQMFKRFGSEVTMLEHSARILPHEDEDIADAILKILQEDNITVYAPAKAEAVRQLANNKIQVTVTINGEKKELSGSHLLIAAGRVPQTDVLQLQKTKVETDDNGFIKVNDKLETSMPGIFALGDVKGGPAFTHISYNDYIVIAKNLLENGNASIAGRMVPSCMFTDPQLGRIGLTENEARKKGYDISVAKIPMKNIGRAIENSETRGLLKAVVNNKDEQILGAAIIGAEGGELMSLLQMAMAGHIPYSQLREMIFAHPLYAESLNNLFMQLDK